MRKLKITLANDKPYTFSTLTIKEQTVARRFDKLNAEEQAELDAFIKKAEDKKDLTSEEEDRLDAVQNKQIRGMLKSLLKTIAKHHEEFMVKPENIEDAYDRLENLIDLRDMKRLTSFALMGSLPREEETIDFEYEEEIDLTGKK